MSYPRWLLLELAADADLPPPRSDVRTQPVAPEVTMAVEKSCSKCGKKLRSDNTKGVCSVESACRRRVAGGGAGDDQVVEQLDLAKSKTPPKSDALKRFRLVADAMGFDADELLVTYCEGWLAAVKQAVAKVEGGG